MATSTIQQVISNSEQQQSGTGYCKMPDGTLIQWGILNVGDIEANSTGAGTFTFPVAFINNNYIAASTSRYTTVASLRATNGKKRIDNGKKALSLK